VSARQTDDAVSALRLAIDFASLRHSCTEFVQRIWARVLSDDCLDLAAQMSFYFVLSIFPFFLVVAAIVGWLPSTNLWHALVQWITDYLPQGSRHLLFSVILDLTNGYTRFLSVGLLVTVWTASSGFVSLMEALSIAHGGRDTRNFWKKRLIAVIATLVSAIFFLGIFGLASMSRGAAGMLSHHLRALAVSKAGWEIARWLANLLLILLAISLANYFLPDAKRTWRWLTPGTSFVALTFVLASVAFNIYIRHSPDIPRVYGTLAGFIVFMMWIYMANLILLIGAETDTAIEEMQRKELTA
jgi:membrane protein